MAALSSIIGALGVVSSFYTAKQESDAQKRQLAMAREDANRQEERARKTERQQEAAMNKANRRRPDAQGILAGVQQRAKAGSSGTLLTGPSGVNPGTLLLGQPGLLGS